MVWLGKAWGGGGGGGGVQRTRERETPWEEIHVESSNSKTLFCKDRSLGSVKKLTATDE